MTDMTKVINELMSTTMADDIDRSSPAYKLGIAEYHRDRYKTALEEIARLHLGDCPASMDEVDFARAHNSRVRRIAHRALTEDNQHARD